VLQRRDRALRRLELLRLQGGGEHVRSVRELETVVAALWPRSSVRYIARDAAATTERPIRRLIREACSNGTTAVDASPDGASLLTPHWTHRLAVPVSNNGALLIEPAAAGEVLDEESVAAATVVTRMWSLVERQEALQADLRSLRHEDPETGCMTGASLPRRLDSALQSPEAGGQAAVLMLQIDQLNSATDMNLAARVGRVFAATGGDEGFDVFRMRPWRYALIVPGGTLGEARSLAQRLRLAARQIDGATCTASVGVALAPVHGSTACELVDAAEHAMNIAAAGGGDADEVARQRGRSRVVEADIYRKIEALRTLGSLADQVCHDGLAHSHAVAQRATRIAVAMDLDRQSVLAVALAGELHEIGSLFVGSGEEDDRPNAVRALLASRLIRMAGLRTASEAVAAMHERVDGTGVPGHQAGADIPIGARILAVANAFETVLDGLGRGDRGVDAAIRHMRDETGKSFDRKVAAIALAQASDARSDRQHPPMDGPPTLSLVTATVDARPVPTTDS
jgi:GGDEF domain-containing protein